MRAGGSCPSVCTCLLKYKTTKQFGPFMSVRCETHPTELKLLNRKPYPEHARIHTQAPYSMASNSLQQSHRDHYYSFAEQTGHTGL